MALTSSRKKNLELYFTVDKFSLSLRTISIPADLTKAINNRKTDGRRRHFIRAGFHLTILQYVYPLTERNMFQRKSSWVAKKKRRQKETTWGCFTHAFYYRHCEMYVRENYSAGLGLGIDLLSVVGRKGRGREGKPLENIVGVKQYRWDSYGTSGC